MPTTPAHPRPKPARVLLVTTHYYPVVGGIETHARNLAEGLTARGSRVLVVTGRLSADDRRVVRVGRVPVLRRGPIGRRRWTKWFFVPVAFAVAWRLRRRFDVIFCPDLRAMALAGVAASWATGKPVVIKGDTPGAYSAEHWYASAAKLPVRPPHWLVTLGRRALFHIHRRVAGAVCVTHAHEQEARESGIASDRIHYIPHGVDTTRFAPLEGEARLAARRRLGWADDQLVVVYVGRLSAEKGVMELLDAWRRRPHPDAKLVVVGPDVTGHPLDRGPQARQLVADEKLGESVTFTGPTETPEDYMRPADLLVQPSHYEAFPLTVIEGMAAGVPVVATWVGGLRDYLVDGVNALVCSPSDVGRLAECLDAALADHGLRARLADAGRQIVLEQFSQERNLDLYSQLFDHVATLASLASLL